MDLASAQLTSEFVISACNYSAAQPMQAAYSGACDCMVQECWCCNQSCMIRLKDNKIVNFSKIQIVDVLASEELIIISQKYCSVCFNLMTVFYIWCY